MQPRDMNKEVVTKVKGGPIPVDSIADEREVCRSREELLETNTGGNVRRNGVVGLGSLGVGQGRIMRTVRIEQSGGF